GQLAARRAACHVAPPSTETSTPATVPPTSLAVPMIAMRTPLDTVAPAAGDVTVEVGAVVSLDAAAGTRPACNVCGCTSMSANRLTVACCMRGSGIETPRSCTPSSPHAHCTVPAPNTSAVFTLPNASTVLLRYSVSECVAMPAATFAP